MPSFAGKVAVVTGAAGNLGHVVVLALTDQDAGVALWIDSDTGALGTVHAELLSGTGTKTATFAADLIAPESVTGIVEHVRGRFGHIDILADIAGRVTGAVIPVYGRS